MEYVRVIICLHYSLSLVLNELEELISKGCDDLSDIMEAIHLDCDYKVMKCILRKHIKGSNTLFPIHITLKSFSVLVETICVLGRDIIPK